MCIYEADNLAIARKETVSNPAVLISHPKKNPKKYGIQTFIEL